MNSLELYRDCAGIVLTKGGLVFVGQRLDALSSAWQMPQGGIEPGETAQQAALRELEEETGIPNSAVTILAESKGWLTYDLPAEIRKKLWSGRYMGQRQKWFLMRFEADDRLINIETSTQEFSAWKWVMPADAVAGIVSFKQDIYRQVLHEFSLQIG